ncbi:dual specificity protein phosphatase family protein [Planctomicrobium piriforme]|uniref:Dual specificity phosphatase, catalytic domain n=1 Tax=Planctomicrobium piriforme TaxID=1576369 RepID=A0A1I3DGA7_9PLAN|nr:dual specificity protein phosphatase family protein [Planctomicrobium piriforme]SFH85588.1 Dual specificity phosphatase, catalytic domain [Planctomicrobium piriforme]
MKRKFISHRVMFALVFGLLAIVLAVRACRTQSILATVILAWVSANAFVLSLAYLGNWKKVFGKAEKGNLFWLAALFMSPMLAVIHSTWKLQNLFLSGPASNQVTINLFLGRRCEFKELPSGIGAFVDLTAEFATPASIRKKLPVYCIPTLDGCAPAWNACEKVFNQLHNRDLRIYVCCANGYGRSVTFLAAWLCERGVCRSPQEAIELIQSVRPQASPNRDQINSLILWFQTACSSPQRRYRSESH